MSILYHSIVYCVCVCACALCLSRPMYALNFDGKSRIIWLPDGETILKIRLLVLTEFTNVTVTDKQTPYGGIGRACIASRGKNSKRYGHSHNGRRIGQYVE